MIEVKLKLSFGVILIHKGPVSQFHDVYISHLNRTCLWCQYRYVVSMEDDSCIRQCWAGHSSSMEHVKK